MERFRVAVGHRDRVKPGNLVGAIANETGLKGKNIGRIQIFESTVASIARAEAKRFQNILGDTVYINWWCYSYW